MKDVRGSAKWFKIRIKMDRVRFLGNESRLSRQIAARLSESCIYHRSSCHITAPSGFYIVNLHKCVGQAGSIKAHKKRALTKVRVHFVEVAIFHMMWEREMHSLIGVGIRRDGSVAVGFCYWARSHWFDCQPPRLHSNGSEIQIQRIYIYIWRLP